MDVIILISILMHKLDVPHSQYHVGLPVCGVSIDVSVIMSVLVAATV